MSTRSSIYFNNGWHVFEEQQDDTDKPIVFDYPADSLHPWYKYPSMSKEEAIELAELILKRLK